MADGIGHDEHTGLSHSPTHLGTPLAFFFILLFLVPILALTSCSPLSTVRKCYCVLVISFMHLTCFSLSFCWIGYIIHNNCASKGGWLIVNTSLWNPIGSITPWCLRLWLHNWTVSCQIYAIPSPHLASMVPLSLLCCLFLREGQRYCPAFQCLFRELQQEMFKCYDILLPVQKERKKIFQHCNK